MIEGDRIKLNCCTNSDANPQVKFQWAIDDEKLNRIKLLNNKVEEVTSDGQLCNSIELNVNRFDNNYDYKCTVTNEALVNGLSDSIRLRVECKFLATLLK